jgi:DNA helicase II / ATP-dependent DNA helicase PcrA
LGDLFERNEIRDLLSLVSIDAETGGIGLVRVATLSEYGVSRDDTLKLIRWSQENSLPIFTALKRASEVEGITAAGRDGLTKLGHQLEGLKDSSPWTLLTSWLFERSDYLRPMLASNSVTARQKLVAIYQLLKVCGEYAALGDTSRKKFLDRIRRIEALNEDTTYRAISSEASDLDAVRVMTIHGSKGLEFQAVHLPAIATGYMPNSWRGIRVPPPPTLSHLAMQSVGHDAEEEGLFFVALSRARDYLSLTRAEKYTTRGASASKFLTSLSGTISPARHKGSGKSYMEPSPLRPRAPQGSYLERDLDLYTQCPARYRYEVLEGLRGSRDQSAYIRFHRCVYATIGCLETERAAGKETNVAAALARLGELWSADGPVGHGFEQYYRNAAEGMVRRISEAVATESGQYAREEWAIPLSGRKVLVTPDRVLVASDGSVRVQRIRTGRKTKSELERPIYALLREGVALMHPGKRASIEIFYLATGECVLPVAGNDQKSLGIYADAIAGIERGDFHAETDTRRCPNCPSYFICGS